MHRRRRWIVALAGLTAATLAAVAVWQGNRPQRAEPSRPTAPVAAEYAGSASCRECHAQAFSAWSGSQHGRAMQHASDATIRGDFNDARLTHDGVTSMFFRRDGRFVVRTDGPDGRLADFPVKYTFGVAPLQQYLVELPGGRLQALALSWDTRPKEQGGQRWFRQYPDEKLDHRDELHWTKRSQNWNFMCADCHSIGVTKGYDAATDTFDTRYREVSVGCEACHGPGSAHIAWTRERGDDPTKGLTVRLDERRGVSWTMDAATGIARRSRDRTTDREVEVCAQCHARRAQIAEGYRAGAAFLDHYVPSLLMPGLYHADGQQRDEVFVWGSWLQSRMNRRGVTCSDCHEPHGGKLRAEGNAVCTQCHLTTRYDVPAHHRHAAGSSGARCVECHMPRTTYMVIDGRRDHRMGVPRPDESIALGVPNACSRCHVDRDAPWAADALRGWRGSDPRPAGEGFAFAFRADETGRAVSGSLAAIANDLVQPAIVRASAIQRLAVAGGGDPDTAQRAARDVEPLIRLASVQLAETLPPEQGRAVLAPLLADRLRAVRIETARAMAGLQAGLGEADRAAWEKAAAEYVATLRYAGDRPEARVALGTFHARLGRFDEAQAAFEGALALDDAYVPAYVNAADALRHQGRNADATAMLRRGLTRATDNAALRHALGLALVREGRSRDAVTELQQAARLGPDEPRYTYVYAVALNSTGRRAEALVVLGRAVERWPENRNLLFALATMQRDAGKTEAAIDTAARLAQTYPGDPEVSDLLRQLRRP